MESAYREEDDDEELPPKLVSHGKRVGSSRDKEKNEEQHVYCTVSDKLLSRRQQASSGNQKHMAQISPRWTHSHRWQRDLAAEAILVSKKILGDRNGDHGNPQQIFFRGGGG